MAEILKRYETALGKIGTFRLLALPDCVKSVLMQAKTEMLELIAAELGL